MKRNILFASRMLLACSVLYGLFIEGFPATAAHSAPHKPMAALVIDDLGNGMHGTEEIMELSFPLTVAVMPFMSTTERDAEWAYLQGHEVIVHLPMEPKNGKREWLGPGAILTGLDDGEIRRRVEAAIDNVPHAVGMNNHMGSKATSDPRVMRIVMEVCRERGLYYLDSHTNYRSVAGRIARETGVPCVDNHLFLDDIHTKAHIAKQFSLLGHHPGPHDNCIAIGHVGIHGEQTAAVLRSVRAETLDVRLVRVSSLIRQTAAPAR